MTTDPTNDTPPVEPRPAGGSAGSAPGAPLPTPAPIAPPASAPQPAGSIAVATGDSEAGDAGGDQPAGDGSTAGAAAKRRRRGTRGGRGRTKRPANGADHGEGDGDDEQSDATGDGVAQPAAREPRAPRQPRPPKKAADALELPERGSEGKPSAEAADKALVRRKPQIGDTRPAAPVEPAPAAPAAKAGRAAKAESGTAPAPEAKKRKRTKKTPAPKPAAAAAVIETAAERRRGRERNGKPIGRYLMCVQVRESLTQVAVLEGRNLIEHYVSRPADDISQIHGNIYVGKVQNVLPGMEAAFIDIATPKNAVLYRGDVQYDAEDIVEKGADKNQGVRIEQILKAKQLIVCQVTKNPIGAKGARLTQEVSLPGRFVVLVPNSKTYGISKRLPDAERKRLRSVLDRVKPAEHGLIVRTAAEGASQQELEADVSRLLAQWEQIEAKAKKATQPMLLYREPPLAVRVIREEFNAEYRGVVIDDPELFAEVRDYVTAFNPELADRVEFYDAAAEGLPMYERHHIHEQVHKALDRKVWLPSGGSLIIEHTEALTVIDVNTGKNVGTSNLEETVFHNNLEAAVEIARQLRLRDIGGIIVIDFIDMEIRDNRKQVIDAFRDALARDKTRTQVFEISELGLVEMTRKRIGEGLLTNFADPCPMCDGRGVVIDHALLD
jgi:ribonuclease E